MTIDPATASPATYARRARVLYQDVPGLQRLLPVLRPYILPLGPLLACVPADADVLDIGAGTGLFLAMLAETGRIRSGTGVEPARCARATFAAMARRSGSSVPLAIHGGRQADAWPAGRFDAVTLIDVLHHIPRGDRDALLDAAADRVAPGGALIIKDISPHPRWKALATRLHDLLLAREVVHYIDFRATHERLCDNGLTVATHRRLDRLWYSHELLVMTRNA